MALARWMQWTGLCLLAGSAGIENLAGAQTLKPDDALGPIQQYSEEQSPAEFQPPWRTPKATRVTAANAPKSDLLAPPQVDLPDGTVAPPPEPSTPSNAPQRRANGVGRTTEAEPKMAPGDRRLLRPKTGRQAEGTGVVPSLDSLPILESPTKAENLGDTPEPATPRRLFSRFRAGQTPGGEAPAPSVAPSRPARTGWGLFRGQSMNR